MLLPICQLILLLLAHWLPRGIDSNSLLLFTLQTSVTMPLRCDHASQAAPPPQRSVPQGPFLQVPEESASAPPQRSGSRSHKLPQTSRSVNPNFFPLIPCSRGWKLLPEVSISMTTVCVLPFPVLQSLLSQFPFLNSPLK